MGQKESRPSELTDLLRERSQSLSFHLQEKRENRMDQVEDYFGIMDDYLMDFFLKKTQWLLDLEDLIVKRGIFIHNRQKKGLSSFEYQYSISHCYSARLCHASQTTIIPKYVVSLSSCLHAIELHSSSMMHSAPNLKCDRIYPMLPNMVDAAYRERLHSTGFEIFRYTIPITRNVQNIRGGKRSFVSVIPNTVLRTPWDIAIHPITGNLYIPEQIPCRVSIFSPLLERIGAFGSHGTLAGMFRNPTSVAWSPDVKHFIVVDNSNHRVHVYDQNLTWLREIGKYGSNPGEFNNPFFGRFSPDGSLFVTDRLNHRIQQINLTGLCLSIISLMDFSIPSSIPDSILINDYGQLMVVCFEDSNIHVFDMTERPIGHKVILRESKSDKPLFLFRGPNAGFGVCCAGTGIDFYSVDGKRIKEISVINRTAAEFAPSGKLFVISKTEHSISEY